LSTGRVDVAAQPGADLVETVREGQAQPERDDEQHGERAHSAAAVVLVDRARTGRQRRRGRRPEGRDQRDVADVHRHQHEAGDERALVHVADAAAELVGHDDQHQRRRDDLRERSRGGDRTGGQAPVVAVAQHDGQRDQAHRDHRRGDHAGGRRQHRTDEHDGVREAAADRAEELADRVEQVLGHAAAFEDQPHEREEGNGEQRLVRHDAEDAQRQRLEQQRRQQPEFDADRPEGEAAGGERERDRIAEEQEDDERAEHHRRDVRGEEGAHRAITVVRPPSALRRARAARP